MNVGDSRAYILRGSELRLLSKDHSLVARLVEMGKISAEEAMTHPRRNVLYQALGQGTDVEIHISSERLQPNDVIILCSDGLWGEVGDPAIKEVLSSATDPAAAAEPPNSWLIEPTAPAARIILRPSLFKFPTKSCRASSTPLLASHPVLR
jgi:serine/threonine protein phosphatase PrpC